MHLDAIIAGTWGPVSSQFGETHLEVVLTTGPGNQPAVWDWTAKTGQFGSRPVQKPNPLPQGESNPNQYPLHHGFCWVSVDLSVPISSVALQVPLCLVAFGYATVKHNILTFVRS